MVRINGKMNIAYLKEYYYLTLLYCAVLWNLIFLSFNVLKELLSFQ